MKKLLGCSRSVGTALFPMWILASLATPPALAQGIKLSGPLARPLGGDIRAYEVSPDGSRVAYVADQDNDNVFELYAAKPNAGSRPFKLAGPRVEGGDVYPRLWLGPKSQRLVFTGDLELDNVYELYSVPLDGGEVVKLNGPLVSSGDVLTTSGAVQIDPAERRVVYLADQDANGVQELYSVPIVGGPALKLNPPLAGFLDVSSFQISPDGTRVVYLADQEQDGVNELFSVPITGGRAAKLNPSGIRNVHADFRLDRSTARVAFGATLVTGRAQLYSAPQTGRAPALELLPVPATSLGSLQLSPGGERIVFVDRRAGVLELSSVPLDGAGGVTILHSIPFSTHSFDSFVVTPDARFVLFQAGPSGGLLELLRVPIDGFSVAVPLALTPGYGDLLISQDGALVVHLGFDGAVRLFSTRIDGSAPPVQISAESSVHFEITTDGARVVFLASHEPYALELFSAPIAGGKAPVRLNSPLPFGGNVEIAFVPGFRNSSLGRVIYLADQGVNEQFELFSVPADGSTASLRISGDLAIGPVEGDVVRSDLSADGKHAVFVADKETDNQLELFSVRTDGSKEPVALHGPVGPGESVAYFQVSPDSSRVVYWLQADAQGLSELRVVPIEGGASSLLAGPFAGSSVGPLVVDATSTTVVFERRVFSTGAHTLESVPLGGGAPVLIHASPSHFGALITAAGTRVVYVTDLDGDYASELFSAPIDGSAGPLQLDGAHILNGGVRSLSLAPDGSRVLYIADEVVDNRFEAFVVPVDGSAAALRLNPPLGSFQGVTRLLAAGDFAFYSSNQDNVAAIELYRVPLDGSAPPVKLNPPLVNRGQVLVFQVVRDGSRVVYQADQEVDDRFELFSAPSDGSGPVRKLNGALGNGDVSANTFLDDSPFLADFVLSPDATEVVFRADPTVGGKKELFRAPVDGSSPAVKISASLPPQGTVLSGYRFIPNGGGVIYRAFLGTSGLDAPARFALFRASLDGTRGVKRVSDVGSQAPTFELLPGGGRIVYQSDQETDGVVELFLDFLTRPLARSGKPTR